MNTREGSPPTTVEVFGWASDNYADDGPPAVIVNPQASALTLLSWGLGQLAQCNAILDGLGYVRGSRDVPEDVAPAVRHFSVQAETVLRAGVERMQERRR